jgi:DNA-binding transcriptional MerR regulator
MVLPKIKKLYYSIREVSKMTEVPQPTLRYWENEFPFLQPGKNSAGNRIYKASDIKLIYFIKHLLYTQKMTISGAVEIIHQLHNKNELTEQLDRFTIDGPVSDEKDVKTKKKSECGQEAISMPSSGMKTLLLRIKEGVDRMHRELDRFKENLD